ncbi:MAG: hypothetical protein AABM67_00690 [Acidobacteriota bacterium]
MKTLFRFALGSLLLLIFLFDDFNEKPGQFPKGTTFTASKNNDPVVERLFDRIEGVLSARGMTLDRSMPWTTI